MALPFDSNVPGASDALSVSGVVINLLITTALSSLVSWHFVRFGTTFSNREKFARVLAPIALTTVLVISVVKASLALSLGLVGALSIVRFRTPVKEPEELSYIFIAIAIGLGLGADQRIVTVVATVLVLGVLTARQYFTANSRLPNLYLNVEIPTSERESELLENIVGELTPHVRAVDLRRFDVSTTGTQATFYLDCQDTSAMARAQAALSRRFPAANLTFVEQSAMPGA
ncbi:MAG: DUF4956 domain-containing protein [Planctomycetota bacterium]